MKRGLILLSVATLMFGGVATAAVQQGDTELDLLGAWFEQRGKGDTPNTRVFFLSGGIGYFITDNVQISGAAFGAWTKVLGDDLDIYGVGGRAKYHFMPTNQWVPYVGAQIFWAKGDNDEDASGTLWGPMVGLRYELNAYNDFFVEYQYHRWTGDFKDAFRDGHGIFAGIIHQFK
jgi:hypothetical protein